MEATICVDWSRLWQVTEQEPHQGLSLLRRDGVLGSQKSHQRARLQRHFCIAGFLYIIFSTGLGTQHLTLLPKHPATQLRPPGLF